MHKSLWSLALIQGVDSISYMVVAPSLIFYVLQVGGSTEVYGLIISIYSFASFCAKPIMGYWLDAGGNKFRKPYIVSTLVAAFGSFLYFIASSFKETSTTTAIVLIFLGRLLGGVGAANQALGYAYIASVVEQDKQTQTNSILSMVRILGMASGPAFNVLLAKVDSIVTIWPNVTLEVDHLNSVGLFLLATNLFAVIAIYFMLEEPPEQPTDDKKPKLAGQEDPEENKWKALRCCLDLDIILPMFAIFVVNSSFQLIETAFPPAASDALGWGPIQTSGVLGGSSVLLFFCMMLVFMLSAKHVKDEFLVLIGNIFWCVGGFLIFFLWAHGAAIWHFVLPVVICVCGFPFIAPANRSLFTKAVDSKPELDSMHGFMQSILSMAASIAGFLTPGFVAAFCLNKPEDVAVSTSKRELTPLALYVPIFPIFIMIGLYYSFWMNPSSKEGGGAADTAGKEEDDDNDTEPGESTGLLKDFKVERVSRRRSVAVVTQTLKPRTEMNRRSSAVIMGICTGETYSERERRSSIAKDLTNWMDELEEDEDVEE